MGSKARLMTQLRPHLPKGKRLVEPFAGSCSVMLNTEYDEYLIGDVNPDFILTAIVLMACAAITATAFLT
ncbi:DNA adenine methylase [Kosakonia cowanii]